MKTENIKLGDIVLLFYRLLCVTYGLAVLDSNSVHIFGFSLDILNIFLLVYVLIHFLLFLVKCKPVVKSIIGQMIDLAIVAAVLFSQPHLDFYMVSFIVLLLICKDYSNPLSYRITFYIGIPLLLYFFFNYSFKIVLPFLFFWIFDYVNYQVYQVGKERRKLEGMIDDVFLSSNGKVYELYKNVIGSIRRMDMLPIKLENIYCFRWDNNNFYLVNGTKFVWKYSIKESKVNLAKILESKVYKNFNIEIEGNYFDNICFVIHPGKADSAYLFLLECDERPFWQNYYAQILFGSFFYRMAVKLESDRIFKKEQREELAEMSKKMNYVNTSMNTMHFIRNKLSPLKNYIAMYDDYQQSNDVKKAKIKPYLEKEYSNLKKSFTLINERADKLLEEQKNPFVFSVTEKFGLQQLFAEMKYIWQSYGLSEDDISVSLLPKIHGEYKSVYYNKEGLILVFDNWVSNMLKHGVDFYSMAVEETENELIVSYSNNHKMKKYECERLIKMFNNDDRIEINKRNYHGLEVIKDVLTQMNLESELITNNDKLILNIKFFKQVENEKSIDS